MSTWRTRMRKEESGDEEWNEEREESKTPSSIHEALPSRHIRLFNIAPVSREDNMIGGLTIHKLDDDPSYEALSYVWGGAASKVSPSITIDGEVVHVTRSLHTALVYLHLGSHSQMLWIDALCINQNDRAEKKAQIQMMGEIYRQAANVNIWLGKPDDGWNLDFELNWLELFQRDLTALVEDKEMVKQPFYSSEDKIPRKLPLGFDNSIMGVMGSDWFKRIWVVQECALANRVTLHYGKWNCSWTTGTGTTRLLRRLKLVSVCPEWDIITERSTFTKARYSANIWYAPFIELLELSATHQAEQRSPPDLLDLLYSMREKESTNPKDKIYGLMGLGLARCKSPIEVDYDISERNLWRRLRLHLQTCPDHPPI